MTNQPNTDRAEIVVTLPSGAVQAYRLSDAGRYYLLGSTQYYDAPVFFRGLDKMRAAGATVVETIL